jgi:hypothetical protein
MLKGSPERLDDLFSTTRLQKESGRSPGGPPAVWGVFYSNF